MFTQVDELKPSLRYCAYNIGDESAAGDLVAMRGQGLIENLDTLMAQAKYVVINYVFSHTTKTIHKINKYKYHFKLLQGVSFWSHA